MKKLLLLSVLLFPVLLLKANPIVSTPFLITELYFDNNDKWTMELLIREQIINLDNFKFVTSSGEFLFKSGINVSQNGIVLITSDSMQTPLNLNRIGDFIEIKRYSSTQWFNTSISLRYGNVANPDLSYPRIGQSIQLLIINGTYPAYSGYAYVKSKSPSLGNVSINTYDCMGHLNGYVYDNNTNPIPFDSIRFIQYPQTNTYSSVIFLDGTGYFSQNMYARNYNLRIYYPKTSYTPYLDTIISVEPDSTVTCILHITDYISGINELNTAEPFSISNYPNPFTKNATLIIKIPNSTNYRKAIIKFFNSLGEIVKIIPIDGINKNTDTYRIPLSVENNFELNTGTYYYVLEVDSKKVASNKMTLIK